MLDDATLRPLPIGARLVLPQAAEAHTRGEAGQSPGKMVLMVSEP
jgi:hypothetical protein